jgi:uncharacterized membrane protein (DUF106 family)
MMMELLNCPPDDIDNDVKLSKIPEDIIPSEPYVVTSIIISLTTLSILNIVFGPNMTIYFVSILAGFMAWLILTSINPKINHHFICAYTGFLGVLLNTNSIYLKSRFDPAYLKSYLIILVFILLGALYGNFAYRLGKETKYKEDLIYFILFSSFIVRGIFLIRTGF